MANEEFACSSLPLPTNDDIVKQYQKSSSALQFQKNVAADFPHCSAAVESADTFVLYTKAKRLNDKCKLMKKKKQANELTKLLSEHFLFPGKKDGTFSDLLPPEVVSKLTAVEEKTTRVCAENRDLKRNLDMYESTNENLAFQVKHFERKVSILQNLLEITNEKYKNALSYKQESFSQQEELQKWESKYHTLSREFEEAVEELHEKKLKLQSQSTRNLNKKIKRRDQMIDKKNDIVKEKEQQIQEKEHEICLLRDENEKIQNKLTELKKDKKNLLQKVCRMKNTKTNVIQDNMHEIETLKLEILDKNEKIKTLEETNSLLSDPVIESFYEGKYTNEIRETVMSLVTECGVSQKKVNQVMEVVVKNLTGKTLSKLPSTGVKSRLLLEAKMVANQQVAETLLDENSTFTLHQDGTSKFHRHFQSFQVTTSEGTTLSLGMPEVSRGDAETIFEQFSTLLTDLIETVKYGEKRENLAKIVTSIIATMSDQGSVNHVFNDRFQKFREELLPVVYEEWDNMSAENQRELGQLFSFFCKMHVFVNIASETDACLSHFENTIIADGHNPYAFASSESGAARLIRTASKAFTSHGCEKSGVGDYFETYLKEKGLQNHLVTFRGHRFNHLFHAAASTYFHLKDIQDFLDKWTDPNDLLRSVSFDARELLYIAGVRALGLIDKVVTGPLWRIIENVPNSLTLNTHLLQLKLTLERWCKDASPLMEGECVFHEDIVKVTKDCVFESLTAPGENALLDTYTQMALEICFGAMLLILERQAKDQLPGGKYWALDDDTCQKLAQVPTTNTVSERHFAQLDVLMRLKPSASTCTYESIVMWSNNKTSSWLNSLSDQEHNSVLTEARKNAPNLLEKMKQRRQNLYRVKLELLKKRQDKKAMLEVKQHANKVKLTQKIQQYGGIWVTIDDLERNKQTISSPSQLKEALIAQLQFRKTVLCSSGPKFLFQQQHQGKQFSVEAIEKNLREVITLNAVSAESPVPAAESKLKYKESEQLQSDVVTLKKSLSHKIEENRMKILISQQKEMLPTLLSDPTKLVGKKIKHKCRDPETKVVEWFVAVVEDIFSSHEMALKTEYNVRYEEDLDNLWHFPLLKDMQNGDMIITI